MPISLQRAIDRRIKIYQSGYDHDRMENSAGQVLPVSAVLSGPSTTIPFSSGASDLSHLTGPGCSLEFLADAMVR
jgi:hypothetical protein